MCGGRSFGITASPHIAVFLIVSSEGGTDCDTYVRDDRPVVALFTLSEVQGVWLAYTPDRKGEHPHGHLANFSGTLQADGYAGFHHLYDTGRIWRPPAGRMSEASCSTSLSGKHLIRDDSGRDLARPVDYLWHPLTTLEQRVHKIAAPGPVHTCPELWDSSAAPVVAAEDDDGVVVVARFLDGADAERLCYEVLSRKPRFLWRNGKADATLHR